MIGGSRWVVVVLLGFLFYLVLQAIDVDVIWFASSLDDDKLEASEQIATSDSLDQAETEDESGTKFKGTDTVKNVDFEAIKANYPPLSKSERYLVFETGKGMSNQRMDLEWALVFCRMLKRICILPPLLPHNHKDDLDQFVSLHFVYDLSFLNQTIKVWPLVDENLFPFLRRVKAQKYNIKRFYMRTVYEPSKNRVITKLSQIRKRYGAEDNVHILFFSNRSFWRCCSIEQDKELYDTFTAVNSNLRYSLKLRQLARSADDYIKQSHQVNKFYALHIRRGDYVKLHPEYYKKKKGETKWEASAFQSFPNGSTVFISTDERKKSYFNSFAKRFSLVYGHDIPPEVHDYFKSFPRTLRKSMLGTVEQLICARAELWVGSVFSTFSTFISRLRTNKALVYDDSTPADVEWYEAKKDVPSDCLPGWNDLFNVQGSC